MHENQIADGIVDAAFKVHRHFGPGLLESAYEACLAHELMTMGFKVSDKSKLAKLKKGDKVKFLLEKAGEEYVVTDIR